MSDEKLDRPKKLQRISQACDLCHRRSIRCRPSVEYPPKCQNCYDFGVDCTYNRPSRRRRNQSEGLSTRQTVHPLQPAAAPPSQSNPSQLQPSTAASAAHPQAQQQPDVHKQSRILVSPGVSDARGSRLTHTFSQDVSPYSSSAPSQFDAPSNFPLTRDERPDILGTAWRAFTLASLDTIEHYLGVYIDVVYPLYPLFHPPTMWEKIRNHEHIADEGFFASTMAACALAAARVRDGSGGERADIDTISAPSSEVFFIAAQDMVLRELHRARGSGFLRACGLLALTAIQYGDVATMHLFMGHYHTLCAQVRFHDETHWPANISVIEKEERRRLVWAMYSLEVYNTIVFDGVMRSQEVFFNVRYPSEVDDEQLMSSIASGSGRMSWMRGWNFAIDLWRVLEHAIKRLRRLRQAPTNHLPVVQLIAAPGSTERQVLDNIIGGYTQLPERFKDYRTHLTGDRARDIFVFQAANIQTALQLVRMTLFAAESPSDLEQRCAVVEQVLSTVHSMSPQLLRDMSAPLIYLLGCVARLLTPPLEGVLGESSYRRMRALSISMADLLAGMEAGLHVSPGASQRLRVQITRIDQYMEAQRRIMSSATASGASQVPPPGGVGGIAGSVLPAQHGRMGDSLGVAESMEGFHLSPEFVSDSNWPWPVVPSHGI